MIFVPRKCCKLLLLNFHSIAVFPKKINNFPRGQLNCLVSFLWYTYKILSITSPFLHSILGFKNIAHSGSMSDSYHTWLSASTASIQNVTALATSSFSVYDT